MDSMKVFFPSNYRLLPNLQPQRNVDVGIPDATIIQTYRVQNHYPIRLINTSLLNFNSTNHFKY